MCKEIAIASGKGGTGKTFIASNLIYYINLNSNVVGIDADVEAPDLVIALGCYECKFNEIEFKESKKAKIIQEKCIKCFKCIENCKFNAIKVINDRIEIIKELCEGCNVCKIVCPVDAIETYIEKTGVIEFYKCNERMYIVSGNLEIGEKTSGHLVFKLRELSKELCSKIDGKYVVIDVAAGIGCQVISSIVNVDKLIIIIEPSYQSIQGAKRIIEIANHFKIKTYGIVNKYDINIEISKKIEDILNIEILGYIPYSYDIVLSYTLMTPLIKLKSNSEISKTLISIFDRIL